MKIITCVTRPEKLTEIEEALCDAGIIGITVTDVRGRGRQGGRTEHYRGGTYEVRLLDKVRLDLALPDERVPSIVNLLMKVAQTGQVGDGVIFVTPVDKAYRIRTGESGEGIFN